MSEGLSLGGWCFIGAGEFYELRLVIEFTSMICAREFFMRSIFI